MTISEAEAAKRRNISEVAFTTGPSAHYVWVTDPELCFVPAKVEKENPDGSMDVEMYPSGTKRHLRKLDIGARIIRISDLKESFEDMVRMTDVNEATILHNLRMRFIEDYIYTNIGTILVSVNPFKNIPGMYSDEKIQGYLHLPKGEYGAPHIFQIAANAYSGLKNERENQSIIISGESGAGKTEATKQCLQFFARAAGSIDNNMQERVLSANPILEAFGNAKTVRNNNSSRFGKWMEVHFNGRGQIAGSRITNYLLEKSRVVSQAPGERNYHIFYQLCLAAPPELRSRLALGRAEEYKYTNQSESSITVDGLDDAAEFAELIRSFASIGIGPEEYEPMFALVAGLLHLSNVTFEPIDSDSCRVSGSPLVERELSTASRLLGVDPQKLRSALENKLLNTGRERLVSPLNHEKAIDARNSMAKAIYAKMFDWLVQRVNAAMIGSISDSTTVIGVLDIFGFEIFEKNSFEQLCINYCNEKLQQHFNYHVFKAEEKCYKDEGIDYAEIKFVDNQDVLDLIEKRPEGLLPKLDDECRVPRGSDYGFYEKIRRSHEDNSRFRGRGRKDGIECKDFQFGVNHYAGPVVYDVNSFLEKNKDELLLNVRELLESSTMNLLKTIFMDDNNRPAINGTPNPLGGDKASQSFQFRNQLDALMKTLNSTVPHYVRCIKPNDFKRGSYFDSSICLQQLRYAGVFEAVKVRQLGFPFRHTYEKFFKRYRCVADDRGTFLAPLPQNEALNWREKCEALLQAIGNMMPNKDEKAPFINFFKFGRTMVLYRSDQNRILELARDAIREQTCGVIQRIVRGHLGRKVARKLAEVRNVVRAAINSRDLDQVQAAIARLVEIFPRELFVAKELKALEERLLEEKLVVETLLELRPLDPADHYEGYEKALEDALRLEITHPIVAVCRAKFNTVQERLEAKQGVAKGILLGDKHLILACLAQADRLMEEWGDILPPGTREQAAEVLDLIAKEEKTQNALRRAIASGAAKGTVGCLDGSTADPMVLEASLAAAASGNLLQTQVGKNLVVTAATLRDLRRALKSGSWPAIETALAACIALRNNDCLAPEAADEVKAIEAEVADRKFQVELTTAMSVGAAKGTVGALDGKSADVTNLSNTINRVKTSMIAVGGISTPVSILLTAAELLLRIRHALAANDWTGLKKAVQESTDIKMPEVCLAEIYMAKAALDNHTMITFLTDAVEKGGPLGIVSKLDKSTVDVNVIADRIKQAEEMGPKTPLASNLLKLATVMLKVRKALLAKDYDAILHELKAAASIPPDSIPARAKDELLVSQYEAEHCKMCKRLREAICIVNVNGEIGGIEKKNISVVELQAAIGYANELKPRAPESLWFVEAASALLAVREAYLDGKWDDLFELLTQCQACDNMVLSQAKLDTLPPIPVLKPYNDHSPTCSNTNLHSLSVPPAYPLPKEALYEIALLFDELHNYTTVTEITNALASGGPCGDLGYISSAKIETEALVRAIARATTAPNKTPLAASLVYTATIVLALRIALQADDWNTVESYLRLVATNNGRLAKMLNKTYPANATVLPGVLPPPGPLPLPNEDLPFDPLQTLLPGSAPLVPTNVLGPIPVPRTGSDPSILTVAAATVLPPGMTEVLRVEAEAQYRRVIQFMLDALRNNAARGTIGSVDVSTCEVKTLATAIDACRYMGIKTPRSSHLWTLCRLMWQLRTSVLESDWAAVEALVAKGAAPLGLDPAKQLEDECVVPPEVLAEVEFYKNEAQNRRIVEVARKAITVGAPQGAIGELALNSIDVAPMETAIRLAVSIGCKTVQAKALVSTALHIRALRLCLLSGDWDRLAALLDYYALAEAKARSTHGFLADASIAASAGAAASATIAIMDSAFASGAQHLAAVGAAPLAHPTVARIGGNTGANAISTDLTGSGEASAPSIAPCMGWWPGIVDSDSDFDIMKHGVALEAGPEIAILQLELMNRRVIALLTNALSIGFPRSEIGKMDPNSIKTESLESAIDYAAATGIVTITAARLFVTAQAMLQISIALQRTDWDALDLSLKQAENVQLSEICHHDIQRAQRELNNYIIVEELKAALSHGAPTGKVGRLNTAVVDTVALEAAINTATTLEACTPEAKQLLFTARTILKLRKCVLRSDWKEAAAVLESIKGKLLASTSIPEVNMIQEEVDNWTVCSDLSRAIQKGTPLGHVGALDVSMVDTHALEVAITQAENLGVKTPEATTLYETASFIFRLRRALLADAWGVTSIHLMERATRVAEEIDRELERAVKDGHNQFAPTPAMSDLVAVPEGENIESLLAEAASSSIQFPNFTANEFALLKGELKNRHTILSLSLALVRGGAKGNVGALNVRVIDTATIDAAITDAVESETLTEEASRLLTAAKLIRRLRSCIVAGNWPWVGSVLMEARSHRNIFPPVSLKELQVAQDELDNRALCSQLTTAISKCALKGEIDAFDVDGIETEAIDAALLLANSLGVKSPEAVKLVATAQVLRNLRIAFKNNDITTASEIFDASRGKELSPLAAEELRIASLAIDNWRVVKELTAAISAGAAQGHLGEADIRSIVVHALDSAIALATSLGSYTPYAKKALVAALLVRRLRAAQIENDFVFMAQVVNEAEVESKKALAEAQEVAAVSESASSALVIKEDIHSFSGLLPECHKEFLRAKDSLELKAVVSLVDAALQDWDEAALKEGLERAAALRLDEHPRPHIREIYTKAANAVEKINKAKEAMKEAIESLDVQKLIDAIAMASSCGLEGHPLTTEASRVLNRIQEVTGKAKSALHVMDAIGMAESIRDCQLVGLGALPLLNELRAALALPRADFLKKELDQVLTEISRGNESAVHIHGIGKLEAALPSKRRSAPSAEAPAMIKDVSQDLDDSDDESLPVLPPVNHSFGQKGRVPTPAELRVVACTIQVKDIYFSDNIPTDDVMVTAMRNATQHSSNTATLPALLEDLPPVTEGMETVNELNVRLNTLLEKNPVAAANIAEMRAARHTNDNLKGAHIREVLLSQPVQVNQPLFQPTYMPALPVHSNRVFRPSGFTRLQNKMSTIMPGEVVPSMHSQLRKQLLLEKYSRLKAPHLFSPKFPTSCTISQSGMLRWQPDPISSSLTILPTGEARKLAVRCFRAILGFMGDRPLARPLAAGAEVVALGYLRPDIRDEIFIQLMKQLNGCPSLAAAERAWVLLYACLCTFAPSDDLENPLELWLREAGASPCVWQLHLTLYRGSPGPRGVPDPRELQELLYLSRTPSLPSLTNETTPEDEVREATVAVATSLSSLLGKEEAAAAGYDATRIQIIMHEIAVSNEKTKAGKASENVDTSTSHIRAITGMDDVFNKSMPNSILGNSILQTPMKDPSISGFQFPTPAFGTVTPATSAANMSQDYLNLSGAPYRTPASASAQYITGKQTLAYDFGFGSMEPLDTTLRSSKANHASILAETHSNTTKQTPSTTASVPAAKGLDLSFLAKYSNSAGVSQELRTYLTETSTSPVVTRDSRLRDIEVPRVLANNSVLSSVDTNVGTAGQSATATYLATPSKSFGANVPLY